MKVEGHNSLLVGACKHVDQPPWIVYKIGLPRSTDSGQTWDAQQVIMDMETYGDMPQEVNGYSDPGIIVDPATGEVFCFAVWTNGRPGTH